MPDRRSVDDLTIDEIEQILRVKKREARQLKLEQFARQGRRRDDLPLPDEINRELPPVDAARPVVPHKSFLMEAISEKRSLRDRLLLAIEIAAALSLVGLLIFAAISIQQLNQESAGQQAAVVAELPTASPTPIISVVVLPGGHTPPTSPGGAQPNYDEVPAYLRPQVEQQFFGPVILPTPGPGLASRIMIERIGVDAPVVQGDGWEQLKQGVAQHIGTANPGQTGNLVLSAHDDIYGEIFRYLDQLKAGDEVVLKTLTGQYTYSVQYVKIVKPNEVSVMASTKEAVVTLISCYPYLVNNKRIVVVAALVTQ